MTFGKHCCRRWKIVKICFFWVALKDCMKKSVCQTEFFRQTNNRLISEAMRWLKSRERDTQAWCSGIVTEQEWLWCEALETPAATLAPFFSNLRDNFRKAPFVTFHETDWRRVEEEKRKRKGRHDETDSLALCSPLFAGPEAFLSEISNTQRSLFLYFSTSLIQWSLIPFSHCLCFSDFKWSFDYIFPLPGPLSLKLSSCIFMQSIYFSLQNVFFPELTF